jgi:hypothetical protein
MKTFEGNGYLVHSSYGYARSNHKYIKRYRGKNGKWVYVYKRGDNKEKEYGSHAMLALDIQEDLRRAVTKNDIDGQRNAAENLAELKKLTNNDYGLRAHLSEEDKPFIEQTILTARNQYNRTHRR